LYCISGESRRRGYKRSINVLANDADAGVYRGLVPRLIGELLTIWLVNIITHVCITHMSSAESHCSQVAYHQLTAVDCIH